MLAIGSGAQGQSSKQWDPRHLRIAAVRETPNKLPSAEHGRREDVKKSDFQPLIIGWKTKA